MAKRQRDHKAEYQRRKEIAAKSGFGSVRKYKRVRKTLSLPRTTTVSVTRIRRDSVYWSADHSRGPRSRYSRDLTDDQVVQYHRAFVQKTDDKQEKLNRLHDYLVDNDLVTEEEWLATYALQGE